MVLLHKIQLIPLNIFIVSSKSLLEKLVKVLWSTFIEIGDSKDDFPPEHVIVLDELETMVADAIHATRLVPRGPKLRPFDGTSAGRIGRFLEDYEEYATSYNWYEGKMLRKIPMYLTNAAKTWYRLNVRDRISERRLRWKGFKDEITRYFFPCRFQLYLREQLRARNQQPRESVSNYVLSKRELCQRLNPRMNEEESLSHLYDGLQANKKSQLYQFSPTTVAFFVDKAYTIELDLCSSNDRNLPESEIKALVAELEMFRRLCYKG